MVIKSHYKNISLDEHLIEWTAPLIEKKTIGFKSHAEFITQAIREKIERYLELGIHPWSKHKKEPEKETKIHPAFVVLSILSLSLFGLALASQHSITGGVVNTLGLSQVNIPQIYERYALMIDFFIFALGFVVVTYFITRKLNHIEKKELKDLQRK